MRFNLDKANDYIKMCNCDEIQKFAYKYAGIGDAVAIFGEEEIVENEKEGLYRKVKVFKQVIKSPIPEGVYFIWLPNFEQLWNIYCESKKITKREILLKFANSEYVEGSNLRESFLLFYMYNEYGKEWKDDYWGLIMPF